MSARQKRCFTIVLGGTSLTNGRLATDWDRDLRAGLKQAVDREVVIVNMGKGSQTTVSWGVPMAAPMAALQPDLILSEGYGINDCAMGVSRADHNANLDTMISTWKAISPRSRLCLQTMSPACASDPFRGSLGDYYADELAKAAQWGIDSINNTIHWPNPLPSALTQIDPATGQPDNLHPIKSANRQYSFPNILAYATQLILSTPG